jgi:hypothetical protein
MRCTGDRTANIAINFDGWRIGSCLACGHWRHADVAIIRCCFGPEGRIPIVRPRRTCLVLLRCRVARPGTVIRHERWNCMMRTHAEPLLAAYLWHDYLVMNPHD